MTITTRLVTISTAEVLGGIPLPLGRVHFTLSAPDKEGTQVVVPVPQPVDLDVNGNGTAYLWPNSKGTAGTYYNVTIRDRYNRVRLQSKGVVPDVDGTALSAVLQLVPSPPLDPALVAVQQSQASAAAAAASAQQVADNKAAIDARVTTVENTVNGLQKGYKYDQGVAASSWSITHNMGKFPSVTVIDSAGDECEGAVTYLSNNALRVDFTSPFSGTAYLN